MKPASLSEIRKQLGELDSGSLEQICLKLARYKKENKELLTYLLFESHDERAYVAGVKTEMDDQFETLPKGNVYYVKKGLRRILRIVNRQIRYADSPSTELDIRIYFCLKVKSARIPLMQGTVLYNLYHQQVKKIQQLLLKLPEDLRFDYDSDMKQLSQSS